MEALEQFELDLLVSGLDQTTPWSKHVGLTRPYYEEEFLLGMPPGSRVPESLRGIEAGVREGDVAAAYLRKAGAVPVRREDLFKPVEPVAAPAWLLEQRGYTRTKFVLFQKKHVMAVAPGENGWLKLLGDYLEKQKSSLPNLIRARGSAVNAIGATYELPAEKKQTLRRAKRLEWTFLAFLFSIIVVMALVMGSSQTMKAMWIEDTLSVVPSCSFLIGIYFRSKEPDETFPYGYRRAVLVGFMCGAVTLLGFGLYIFGDSIVKLIKAEHPIVQTIHLFGRQIWLGWLMIAALIYSVIPPMILGRMKLPLAAELNDKTLHVSAELNKGDWLSGIAGVVGIMGIAFGFWWADAAAAGFISVEIIKDGYVNLRNSLSQLMNRRPSTIEDQEEDPAIDRLQKALEQLPWVAKARVRLREDGDVLTGEAFIEPRDDRELLERMAQARAIVGDVDWRLHDISMVPVRSVD